MVCQRPFLTPPPSTSEQQQVRSSGQTKSLGRLALRTPHLDSITVSLFVDFFIEFDKQYETGIANSTPGLGGDKDGTSLVVSVDVMLIRDPGNVGAKLDERNQVIEIIAVPCLGELLQTIENCCGLQRRTQCQLTLGLVRMASLCQGFKSASPRHWQAKE